MAKRKNRDLKWYAFLFDWNKQKLEYTNVLGTEFAEDVLKRIKREKIDNYEKLKELVRVKLMSRFWSRAEYEVIVTDLHFGNREDYPEFKIDIWYQLEPNLDRIVEYIMRELNIEF